jgi:antitoxin CptB
MRELDVVLVRYLEERYPSAPVAEQQAFEALLETPDPQLFAYLTGREAPTAPEWIDVLNKLANP